MLLARLAEVSREVAATRARSSKTALLAEVFTEASQEERPVVVAHLSGRVPQGRIGIGWSTLAQDVPPAPRATLTVTDADAALTELAALRGPGSATRRREQVRALLAASTEAEQTFLRGLLTGELRQGALASLAVDAVARAADVPPARLREAVMLAGGLEEVAPVAFAEGAAGLTRFTLRTGTAVQPMLAGTAPSVAEALERVGHAVVEEKLDGIRIQVHRSGDAVRVFTRALEEITDRAPEVVRAVQALEFPGRAVGGEPPEGTSSVEEAVLDGELIALDDSGRPRSFQDIGGRVGSRSDVAAAASALPLTPVFFDLLRDPSGALLDRTLAERHERLSSLVPESLRVRRLLVNGPADAAQAEQFLEDALRRGHEGVVVKSLDARYSAGRRGTTWLKVKPVHTADLVVLGVERGHGRRTGLLSNLHLGAADGAGGFVMLGKTFKGLTDALLRWQTDRLLELATEDDGHLVRVRPELVVEIAYDGLQRSTRYPAGITLRFARVVRYREDKSPAEADTVDRLRAAHAVGRSDG